MTWPNCELTFHVGQRVAIPERGQGRVVEVLERVRDCDGQLRTAYRVWLDCGREFWGHPANMRPVTVTSGGHPATSRKAKETV